MQLPHLLACARELAKIALTDTGSLAVRHLAPRTSHYGLQRTAQQGVCRLQTAQNQGETDLSPRLVCLYLIS